MRLRTVIAAAALLSASLIARADSYTTFDLNSTFNYSGSKTVTGTLTLDDTTDTFSSVDLVASGFGLADATLNTITYQGQTGHPPIQQVDLSNGFLALLNLYLPVSTLTGYEGGAICTFGASGCKLDDTSYDVLFDDNFAVSGSLSPDIAPAPEPSTLVLLGTGLLGMAGVVRRRMRGVV